VHGLVCQRVASLQNIHLAYDAIPYGLARRDFAAPNSPHAIVDRSTGFSFFVSLKIGCFSSIIDHYLIRCRPFAPLLGWIKLDGIVVNGPGFFHEYVRSRINRLPPVETPTIYTQLSTRFVFVHIFRLTPAVLILEASGFDQMLDVAFNLNYHHCTPSHVLSSRCETIRMCSYANPDRHPAVLRNFRKFVLIKLFPPRRIAAGPFGQPDITLFQIWLSGTVYHAATTTRRV